MVVTSSRKSALKKSYRRPNTDLGIRGTGVDSARVKWREPLIKGKIRLNSIGVDAYSIDRGEITIRFRRTLLYQVIIDTGKVMEVSRRSIKTVSMDRITEAQLRKGDDAENQHKESC